MKLQFAVSQASLIFQKRCPDAVSSQHRPCVAFTSCTRSNIAKRGRTGLMVRASDSGSGDPGSILGRVGVFVSLSKRHLLPKGTGNTQE